MQCTLRRALPIAAVATAAGILNPALAATDEFTISLGDTVAPGVPGPGAGELEAPGDIDRYFIDLVAGESVYFDDLPGGAVNLRWRLLDPNDVEIDDSGSGSDLGRFEIDLTGTWTIEVYDPSDDTGQYSFATNLVTDDGPFAIAVGDVVGVDVPGPGAGSIELPGHVDRYEFSASAGDEVFFQSFDISNFSLRWRCVAPSGAVLFDSGIGVDSGLVSLDESGTWLIEVFDQDSATGTYGFQIWPSNFDGPFVIGLEQPVNPGVPFVGGGELETPGSVDTYVIDLDLGDRVFFESFDIGNFGMRWRLEHPDGSVIFNGGIGVDRGPFDIDQSGTYTITVFDTGDAFGTYGLTVWEVRDDGPISIGIEAPVGLDVPAPGAGSIDDPGDSDTYIVDLTAGQRLFFQSFNISNFGLEWRLEQPDGTNIFSGGIGVDRGPLVISQTGEHTIVVRDTGAATGTYEFTIWEVDDDGPFAIALNSIVQPGAPGPGAGDIEEPGNADRYEIDGEAGDMWCIVSFDIDNFGLRWRLEAPSGDFVFDSGIGVQHPKTLLPETGTYRVVVADNNNGDAVGTYSFVVNETTASDVNDDCFINFADLLAVLSAFGPCTPGEPCPEDVDGSGDVGFSDILTVLADWTN